MFGERFQPVLEGLLRIDDYFQLAIGQPPDNTRGFRRQGDLDPLAAETEQIGDLKDPADLFK